MRATEAPSPPMQILSVCARVVRFDSSRACSRQSWRQTSSSIARGRSKEYSGRPPITHLAGRRTHLRQKLRRRPSIVGLNCYPSSFLPSPLPSLIPMANGKALFVPKAFRSDNCTPPSVCLPCPIACQPAWLSAPSIIV